MLPYYRHMLRCLLLLLPVISSAVADSAYLQPAVVYQGDISELVIEYDNSIPSLYALDTSLLEADFEVLDTKSRVFRMLEDGNLFHRMQWRLQLLPRRNGRLSVPPLRLGENSTPALTLEVKPVPPALQSQQQVFIELASSTPDPYIGQQTLISTRLYRNVPLIGGRLGEPQTDNAVVHRHNGESTYREIRDGASFEVLQRSISLFPERSGELLLLPANYNGTLEAATGATLPSRMIFRRSEPLRLQVRDPPPDYAGRFWLPASELEISQTWNQSDNEIMQGNSLDWTLSIIARGLPAESLPADLLVTDSSGLRIYADQAKRSNGFDGEQVVGRLDQRFAIVASNPGEIRLPTVSLKWWDVDSDSEQQALLAGKTIKVIAVGQANVDSTTAGEGGLARLRSLLGPQDRSGWLLMLLLPGIMLLVYCIVILQARINDHVKRVLKRWAIKRRLRICCLSNDARKTRGALLDWGRQRWPEASITGLNQIGQHSASRELAEELKRLDAALYARQVDDWRGLRLWRLIARVNRSRRSPVKLPANALPPLYPAAN